MKRKFYVAMNGRMVLHLEPEKEGGYVVTSPYDPELVTEADTLEDAFEMAEDAAKALAKARKRFPPRRKRQAK
jgi:predicted RNase H-like HicB family nuclease